MESKIYISLAIAMCIALGGCSNNSTPKPQAYLRIDMPQADYRQVDTMHWDGGQITLGDMLPFTFEMNNYAQLNIKKKTNNEVWVDLNYPQWDGVAFLSFKWLRTPDDLRGQTDTSLRLLESHYQFASGVEEEHYDDFERQVFGTTYRLGGNRVASTYQFWVTDSASHFLRGALYLNRTPNNDSLAPVLEYLQADLDHLIETIHWR